MIFCYFLNILENLSYTNCSSVIEYSDDTFNSGLLFMEETFKDILIKNNKQQIIDVYEKNEKRTPLEFGVILLSLEREFDNPIDLSAVDSDFLWKYFKYLNDLECGNNEINPDNYEDYVERIKDEFNESMKKFSKSADNTSSESDGDEKDEINQSENNPVVGQGDSVTPVEYDENVHAKIASLILLSACNFKTVCQDKLDIEDANSILDFSDGYLINSINSIFKQLIYYIQHCRQKYELGMENIFNLSFYGLYFANTILMPLNSKNAIFFKTYLKLTFELFQNNFSFDMFKNNPILNHTENFLQIFECIPEVIRNSCKKGVENFIKEIQVDENSVYFIIVNFNIIYNFILLEILSDGNLKTQLFSSGIENKFTNLAFKIFSCIFLGFNDIKDISNDYKAMLMDIYIIMKLFFTIEIEDKVGKISKLPIDMINMNFLFTDFFIDNNMEINYLNDVDSVDSDDSESSEFGFLNVIFKKLGELFIK
ncbi:hypothetical protein DMUE_2099 [Dictyocoela muelleri]|nr:hypothetical protein DMUE_2099 [Dictyocoela muelleri]